MLSKEKKKKEQASTSKPKITTSSSAKGKAITSAPTKQKTNYLKPKDYSQLPVETLQAIETQPPPPLLTTKS